ncbi:hypothetical protein GS399_09280 [Pedobacter sp. HMF7647]|uniref:Phosphate-starvation-inducible PsiE family protein n=1 Tax=Hufsiella arboris TaxID=2695275 RepID=A0A7K1Y9R7_9SPHI|nr:phosphate-starvation-inducible PsiE family protein [Hufsiella arboris]MXV51160.1 hypothetical protein [Hufsiella arboris]
MENVTKYFDKIITYTLLIISGVFILILTVDLVYETFFRVVDRVQNIGAGYAPDRGKNVFILFFNVLLMMEVMETVRVFNKAHVVKIRIILLVCLIAISRKIFVMDVEKVEPIYEFALAALIVAVSTGYFLISKSDYFDRITGNKQGE